MIIFSDIDDTLIQTKKKCPPNTILYPAGPKSSSFYSEQQRKLTEWFGHARIIPVTGRDSEALSRVSFAFNYEKVVDHGAMVLNADGTPDNIWLEHIKEDVLQWREFLYVLSRQIEEKIKNLSLALRCHVLKDHGMACYISIKGIPEHLRALDEEVAAHKAFHVAAVVHENGENMALLPHYTSKSRAVQYLMDRYKTEIEHPLFIGAGDSHSDKEFMALCHYQLIPSESQIFRDATSS